MLSSIFLAPLSISTTNLQWQFQVFASGLCRSVSSRLAQCISVFDLNNIMAGLTSHYFQSLFLVPSNEIREQYLSFHDWNAGLIALGTFGSSSHRSHHSASTPKISNTTTKPIMPASIHGPGPISIYVPSTMHAVTQAIESPMISEINPPTRNAMNAAQITARVYEQMS